MRLVPPDILKILAAAGVLIYGGTDIWTLLEGGNFLNYSVLASTSVKGQHLGILIIEFGVGLTVAAAMMLIFFAFVSRGDNKI